MMGRQTIKIQKMGKQSEKQRDFYKGLEQKYINAKSKSNYSSIKQSRNLEKQRQSFKSNKRKNNIKQTKDKTNKQKELQKNVQNLLHLPSSDHNSQLSLQIKEQFNFDLIFSTPLQCAQSIRLILVNQKIKFASICINSITNPQYPLSFQTKTQSICSYIQPFAQQFQKVTICMYSLNKDSHRPNGKIQFYDMLSIRREVKTDTKLLIQTNICNNSKSSIILKKLFEVAKQRQKIMELEVGVSAVVIKLRGIISMIEDKQNNDGQNCSRQLQLQISTGGYGEIGSRDLMGAEKLRYFFNIHHLNTLELESIIEILSQQTPHLKSKRKKEKECQSQLIKKIKDLQSELSMKKKQLQEQKQRIANQQAIQAELQDIVLPSQRPMVNLNIQKYQSKVISVSKNFYPNFTSTTINTKNIL